MRKRPIIIAFLLLFFVLGAWSLFFFLQPTPQSSDDRQTGKDRATALDANTNALSLDTDNDGLKDWEEILLGTDPTSADTDKDGTSDKEEMLAGRNPLVAGPDDNAPFKETKVDSAIYAGALTKELALTITQGLSQNKNLNEQNINEVIDTQLIQTIKNAPPLPDIYTKNDIVIVSATDTTIREYANTIGSIFETSFASIEKGELELLREIGRSKEIKDTSVFLEYRDAYRTATKLLDVTPVPEPYATIHLALLNNFNNLTSVNDSFSRFFEDPIAGAIAISQYNKETERFTAFVKDITHMLETDGLAFSSNETGQILFTFRDDTQ